MALMYYLPHCSNFVVEMFCYLFAAPGVWLHRAVCSKVNTIPQGHNCTPTGSQLLKELLQKTIHSLSCVIAKKNPTVGGFDPALEHFLAIDDIVDGRCSAHQKPLSYLWFQVQLISYVLSLLFFFANSVQFSLWDVHQRPVFRLNFVE
mmetsp:Transcript_128623/g.293653  ORF Transcript_128623/g.293653 Transcript_128623/m.293653 type:complete len:148 (-) Transcript_128623:295-738(-)